MFTDWRCKPGQTLSTFSCKEIRINILNFDIVPVYNFNTITIIVSFLPEK